MSKIAAEEACRSYSRRGVLSTVCIRPCYCWGISLGDEARESLLNPGEHFSSLWVYIHLRDVARAYRLACEAPGIEHETFYVAASDIRSNVPTADLVERYYPGVPLARPMGPYDALIANDRAKEVLGFEPTFSWRDEIPPESIPDHPGGGRLSELPCQRGPTTPGSRPAAAPRTRRTGPPRRRAS